MRRACCLIVALLFAGCTGSTSTRRTTNVDHAWHAKFLHDHLTLTASGKTVHFISDRLTDTANASTGNLVAGNVLILQDDHGRTTYTLRSTDATGATFDYEATFDHQSFGKNLITIDTGKVSVAIGQ